MEIERNICDFSTKSLRASKYILEKWGHMCKKERSTHVGPGHCVCVSVCACVCVYDIYGQSEMNAVSGQQSQNSHPLRDGAVTRERLDVR